MPTRRSPHRPVGRDLARDTRFERVTFGFGGQREDKPVGALSAIPVPHESHDPEALARRLLVAAASGSPVPAALITELVEAILGVPLVGLALDARAPGPHQLMHALRLAAAVCEAFAAHRDLKALGEGA